MFIVQNMNKILNIAITLVVCSSTLFAQRGLQLNKQNEITGRWQWFTGTVVKFDNSGDGIEEGKDTIKLTYELVESENKKYRVKWIDAKTEDTIFTDYLYLKNNGTLLEGKSISGQVVTANKIK